MNLGDVEELLHAAPFKPFRVHLSDGVFFDVPHGDFAIVTKRKLIVSPRDQTRGQAVHISLLHVTRIEV